MSNFKVGDTVLLNEQHVVKIESWPAEDKGFFAWVRHDKKDNSETRGLGWYGEVDGAPTTAADVISLYEAASGPVQSTAGPLPEEGPVESAGERVARLQAELVAALAYAEAGDGSAPAGVTVDFHDDPDADPVFAAGGPEEPVFDDEAPPEDDDADYRGDEDTVVEDEAAA